MDSNEPILYDSHMHTPFCKHASGSPEEYAAVAEQRGLKGIIITCHCPGPEGWSPSFRMNLSEFDDYVAAVDRATRAWKGRIDIRLGLECDYVPGMESWLERFLRRSDLQYVIGSVHPQLRYYQQAFPNHDALAFQGIYFEHLALAAESGLFDCLAHPDLVKNLFPRQWQIEHVFEDIMDSLDRIARTGTAMELNTSGLLKEVQEMNPSPIMLTEMNQRDIPVILGSDAHTPYRVGADFERAIDLLLEANYQSAHTIVGGMRSEIPLSRAKASLTSVEPRLPFPAAS